MEFLNEETVVSSPFRVELPAANSPSELDPHGHHDWPAKRRPSRLTFGCGNFLQADFTGAGLPLRRFVRETAKWTKSSQAASSPAFA